MAEASATRYMSAALLSNGFSCRCNRRRFFVFFFVFLSIVFVVYFIFAGATFKPFEQTISVGVLFDWLSLSLSYLAFVGGIRSRLIETNP